MRATLPANTFFDVATVELPKGLRDVVAARIVLRTSVLAALGTVALARIVLSCLD